eukprot:5054869-Prymnesium_polylepis.2
MGRARAQTTVWPRVLPPHAPRIGHVATRAHLAWRCPKVWLTAKADANKHVAQLDACAEGAPHLDHAVAATKSPEHGRLVRNLLAFHDDADSEKCGMWLGSDAMNRLAIRSVQAVALHSSRHDLTLDALPQWQGTADRAKACNCRPEIQAPDIQLGIFRQFYGSNPGGILGWIETVVRRRNRTAKLLNVFVAHPVAAAVSWSLLAALPTEGTDQKVGVSLRAPRATVQRGRTGACDANLRQIMEAEDVNGRAVKPLARWRPIVILIQAVLNLHVPDSVMSSSHLGRLECVACEVFEQREVQLHRQVVVAHV